MVGEEGQRPMAFFAQSCSKQVSVRDCTSPNHSLTRIRVLVFLILKKKACPRVQTFFLVGEEGQRPMAFFVQSCSKQVSVRDCTSPNHSLTRIRVLVFLILKKKACPRGQTFFLVGEEGLEPSRSLDQRILSPPRIPIPPLAH